jgi:hypothetical protein
MSTLVTTEPFITALDEAKSLVYGNRNQDYGHPAEDMNRTAQMWSAVLGTKVTALQVALCMACVKISREMNAHKQDNLVDLAGYAEVASRIVRYEQGLEPN